MTAVDPVRTFEDAERRYNSTGPGRSISDARERVEHLSFRDLTARSVAKLKARENSTLSCTAERPSASR